MNTVKVKLNRTIAVGSVYYQPHSAGTVVPEDLARTLGLEIIPEPIADTEDASGAGTVVPEEPNADWTKAKIGEYLAEKGIEFDAGATKAVLLELIEASKGG